MRVGGDKLHARKTTGDHVAPERDPPGAVLGAVDLHAQDLAVAVGVHARRDQHRDLHDPATLADFDGQRVGGDERVRAGVERSGAERGDLRVEILRHLRHLALAEQEVTGRDR